MKKLVVSLLAIAALLLMVAWMAGMFTDKIAPTVRQAGTGDGAAAIAVRQIETTSFEKVPASVEASQATLISSRLIARITRVAVRAGDNVQSGDLLLELENSDIKAQEQQAEARIMATSARLKEAGQNLERVRELEKGGVVSAADLDRALAEYATLEAQLTEANQALEEARTALGYTRIVAPFDGRIVDRFAEPGDTAQPGMQLLALYNPLNLRVEAQVREHLALGLEVGQQLQVEIPSLGEMLDAVIAERVPAADPGSRSFLVKAAVAYNSRLLPGMYARLLVPAGSRNILLVPADRVAHIGQLDLVWVHENGQSQRRFVRTGQTADDGRIEILAGLEEGDMILPLP